MSALSVVCVLPVFAEVVLVQNVLFHGRSVRRKGKCLEGHRGNGLQGDCVSNRVACIFAPSEWRVSENKHSRHRRRISIGKTFDDYVARVELVRLLHFRFGE